MHNKVFVGGLPPHVDLEELKKIFEQFGSVVDVVVMLDHTTIFSRGSAVSSLRMGLVVEAVTAKHLRKIAAETSPSHSASNAATISTGHPRTHILFN